MADQAPHVAPEEATTPVLLAARGAGGQACLALRVASAVER